MGLKGGAEAHEHSGLVARAGPSVQETAEENGHKGSVLFGRGGVCCGREQKGGQGEKGTKWLCPAWES